MIKVLIIILIKLVEVKLEKVGIEIIFLKNKNYFIEVKKIWDVGDENKRVVKIIDEKLINKVD